MATSETDGARWGRPRFARAFPLLNRKEKRDCSQSNETFDTEVVVVSYDGPLRPAPPSPRSLSVIN